MIHSMNRRLWLVLGLGLTLAVLAACSPDESTPPVASQPAAPTPTPEMIEQQKLRMAMLGEQIEWLRKRYIGNVALMRLAVTEGNFTDDFRTQFLAALDKEETELTKAFDSFRGKPIDEESFKYQMDDIEQLRTIPAPLLQKNPQAALDFERGATLISAQYALLANNTPVVTTYFESLALPQPQRDQVNAVLTKLSDRAKELQAQLKDLTEMSKTDPVQAQKTGMSKVSELQAMALDARVELRKTLTPAQFEAFNAAVPQLMKQAGYEDFALPGTQPAETQPATQPATVPATQP